MSGIFKRFFLATVAVVLFVIVFSAFLLNQSLARFLTAQKQDFLISTGEYLNTLLIRANRGELAADELSRAVNHVGETANARIIILDFKNVSHPDQAVIRETLGTDDPELIEGIENILAGRTIMRQRQYDHELGIYVVAVGIPSRIDGRITGAIILFSPVYQVDEALRETRGIIMAAALIAFVFALLIVWWSAKRISLPIVRVSKAADRFATGQPVEDLPGLGKDEVGTLVQSFNEMKNKISALERMRKDLLADVSHELRTPLTAIRGFIQGLLDGVIPPESHEKYLTLAMAETQRLTSLVNQLLDTARLEAGSFSLQKREVNLTALLEETVRLLTPGAAAVGITLTLQAKQVSAIWADPDRLRQVLLNILGNAVRYSKPKDSVTIRLTETQQEVQVCIRDTGVGIPTEEVPFVFEKFYRAKTGINKGNGGSGLGLFVAREIIKQHGGRITLESVLGEGTTVTIDLPK